MNYPKQIIVIRKDLNMRKGKMVSQGAHASMGAVLSVMQKEYPDMWHLAMDKHPALQEWLNGPFTKITVSVDSEQELLDLQEKAKEAGFINCLITDNGTTEFGGVPTNTALAIGPAYSDELAPLTGHLKLL